MLFISLFLHLIVPSASTMGSNDMMLAKPAHQKSLEEAYPSNIVVLPKRGQLSFLMTKIRDASTPRAEFIFHSERLIRLLIEEALNLIPLEEKTVLTPTGMPYHGHTNSIPLCGVSVMRAGESMEIALREVLRGVKIGKILIQRNEWDASPMFIYEKLPDDISKRFVLLLDPMLATGGTIISAIKRLLERGVAQENIVFINLVASPEGITTLMSVYPKIRIVTAEIDPAMNDKKYIIPGLGDFGCRYFGTEPTREIQ